MLETEDAVEMSIDGEVAFKGFEVKDDNVFDEVNLSDDQSMDDDRIIKELNRIPTSIPAPFVSS